GCDAVGYPTRARIRRRRRGRRLPARLSGAHARLETYQGGRVPDGEDNRHGVLAVRRIGAVLRGVRDPGWAGVGRAMGAVAEHDAGAVYDPVAGDYLCARLAA